MRMSMCIFCMGSGTVSVAAFFATTTPQHCGEAKSQYADLLHRECLMFVWMIIITVFVVVFLRSCRVAVNRKLFLFMVVAIIVVVIIIMGMIATVMGVTCILVCMGLIPMWVVFLVVFRVTAAGGQVTGRCNE